MNLLKPKRSNILLLLLFLTSCSKSYNLVTIPANQSIEIDYPQYAAYQLELQNKSLQQVEVQVLNKKSGEFMSGFGLGIKADAIVTVKEEGQLVLRNESNNAVKVKIGLDKKELEVADNEIESEQSSITFTLVNNSPTSIPLIIPNVMNPNLSPFSNSGVDLKIGQKIFFKENGKKYLLLVVDNNINQGEKLDVGKLLKARKKELGLG